MEQQRATVKIDAHQHFWRYDAGEYGWIGADMAALKRDFLPEDLRAEQLPLGFGGSVAVQARQSLAETEWLLRLADENPRIGAVVGWVDLRAPDAEAQLRRLAGHPKLRGVRHVVQDEPDDRFMLREDFQRGVALLRRFGLTYDILIYARHLPVACDFVSRFPDQPFVLDHLGKPPIRQRGLSPWREYLRRLAAFPNVRAKLSGLVTEADWRRWRPEDIRPFLDVAMEAFGPRRLMIGSDWPVCTLAGSYAQVMGVVLDYVQGLGADERDAVLGGTASGFYGIAAS